MWSVILVSPPVLDFAAAWLDTNFPPTNFPARAFAMRLRNLAAMMRDMDPQWCYAVTGDRSCSTPHDGIVAVGNQRYPGPAPSTSASVDRRTRRRRARATA